MAPRPKERRVRPAAPADLPALRGLLEETYRVHARLAPAYFAPTPAQPALGDDRAEAVLVAEADGRVVGMVRVRLYDTPPDPGLVGRRRLHIVELVVDPAHRRSGHGRALLAAARGWGKARGARDVVLTLWSGNEEAERFYAALGFRCINRVLAQDL